MSKTTKIIRALLLTSFMTVLCLNSTKANIQFDSHIYKNREANTKLIQYVHERVTGIKSMNDSITLYGKSYFFAYGMHGPAIWNQLISEQGIAGQAHDYVFFLKLLQNKIISLKHIQYNTYQITVDGNPFNFFFYGAKKECPRLFENENHVKNAQHAASLIISAVKHLEGTGPEHVKIENKDYPYTVTHFVPNTRVTLNKTIIENYPHMTVPAGIIQALKDNYLTIFQPSASKISVKIGNLKLLDLTYFKITADIVMRQRRAEAAARRQREDNRAAELRRAEEAREQMSPKEVLKSMSAHFDDYEINWEKTAALLIKLSPPEIEVNFRTHKDNIFADILKTITYKSVYREYNNGMHYMQIPTNCNENLLVTEYGYYDLKLARDSITNALNTAINGAPIVSAANDAKDSKFVNPVYQFKLYTTLMDYAKAVAALTDKEQQRDAVLTLAMALRNCSSSAGYNLTNLISNISGSYLEGCENMVIAILERFRKGLLRKCVAVQYPDIMRHNMNSHTYARAVKEFGDMYMLAHTEAVKFDDTNEGRMTVALNKFTTENYLKQQYTPKSIVLELQDLFIQSHEKFNNKTIYELMAEWAVATKLALNAPTFAQKYCDQEWPQDEDCDVPNDKFMLYLLLKTELIKRK